MEQVKLNPSGLISIYSNIIKRYIVELALIVDRFVEVLGYKVTCELKLMLGNGQEDEAKEQFINSLCECRHPSSRYLLSKVIQETNPDPGAANLASDLLLSHVCDIPRYEKVLVHAHDIMTSLEPDVIADKLPDGVVDTQTLDEIHGLTKDKNNRVEAVKLLLRKLPLLSDSWYFHFMDALGALPQYAALQNLIDPKYKVEKENYSVNKAVREQVKVFRGGNMSIDELLGGSSDLDKDQIRVLDYSDGGISVKRHKPDEEIRLRSYQEELVATPLKGHNCVICAPTGCGKTVVAIYLIQHHLNEKPNAKVVFFVPTVDLVDQQSQMIRKFLGTKFRISGIKGGATGGGGVPKPAVVRDSHVVVMTPALLLNLLNLEEDCDRLAVTDFSLFIFDECHHTDKNHPYNEIMISYLDLKYQYNQSNLPQVVGLTASLGVGKAKGEAEAREYVLNISSRLDCHYLCTVEKNKEDLAAYVNVPVDELMKVPAVHSNHPYALQVGKLMEIVEGKVTPLLENINMEDILKVPSKDRWSPAYKGFIWNNRRKLPTLPDPDLKRRLITYFEYLTIFHNTLFLNAHLPTAQAHEYLTEEMDKRRRKARSEEDVWMMNIYADKQIYFNKVLENNVEVNIVNAFKTILLKEYKQKPDSRVLVFVMTRELTAGLQQYMDCDDELRELNPGRLVGANVSSDRGGQSAKLQQETIEGFKRGLHKVIIATTVAEEGLDIQQCNLVIKYNHVTNEIAMMQRRGRGRAEGSRSILLAQDGWIPEKEMMNMLREKLMKRAIEFVSNHSHDYFLEEMKKRQETELQDRLIERKRLEVRRKQLGNQTYRLLCRKCDAWICNSTDMRIIQRSHYAIIDDKFWQRVRVEAADRVMVFESLAIAGKVVCGNPKCNIEWGSVIKYRDTFFPTVRAEAIVLERNSEDKLRKVVRKWKTIVETYFVVEPIVSADVLLMLSADKQPVEQMNQLIEEVQKIQKEEEERKAAAQEEAAESVEAMSEESSIVEEVPTAMLIDL